MPFDFSSEPRSIEAAEYYANVALGNYQRGLKIAERRRAAFEALEHATRAPEDSEHLIDWREIAEAFAAVTPKPPAKKPAANAPEWDDYTPAQMKGRGASFQNGNKIAVRFDDGTCKLWSLVHKKGRAAPNWARAVRGAAAAFGRSDIWTIYDPQRGVYGDAAKAREVAREAILQRVNDFTPEGVTVDHVSPGIGPDRLNEIGKRARAFAA